MHEYALPHDSPGVCGGREGGGGGDSSISREEKTHIVNGYQIDRRDDQFIYQNVR